MLVFKRPFESGQYLKNRIIFVLIAIILTSLSINQISERIRYYLSEPTVFFYGMDVQYTLRHPSVTICPVNGFHSPLLRNEITRRNVTNVYELLDVGLDLNDIWTLTGNDLLTTIEFCVYGSVKKCPSGNWRQQFTVYGMCYTIDFPSPYTYRGRGDVFAVSFNNNKEFRHKGFIHDISQDISYGNLERHFLMESLTWTVLYFHHRLTLYQNLSRNPCYDVDTYKDCYVRCLDVEMFPNRTCRLPFQSATRFNLRLCSTAEEWAAAYPMPNDGHAHTAAIVTLKACKRKCGRTCVSHTYDIGAGWLNSYGDDVLFSPTPQGQMRKVVKEHVIYYSNSLMSDIGGIVGLYLGASLLTLVDLLQIALSAVFKYYT